MLDFSVPRPPERGRPSVHKQRMLDYLRAGHPFLFDHHPGRRSELFGPFDDARQRALRTDGVFAWPSYLSFYVESADADLPDEFVAAMANRGWSPPAEVDLTGLTLFGAPVRPWTKPAVDFEVLLGQVATPQLASAFPTLNDVSDDVIANARRLIAGRSPYAAFSYLQYVVVWSKVSFLELFVKEVVRGGADHRRWRMAYAVCVPRFELPAAATMTVAELVAPLRDIEGERWWQPVPVTNRPSWSALRGAPAVLLRDAPYWWYPPEGTDGAQLGLTPVHRVELTDIAVRRWIASRIADLTRSRPISSLPDACATLGVDAHLSADVRIAIEGLLREQQDTTLEPSRIPGFRGPDRWYV